MAFSFKNAGHLFATFFKAAVADAAKVDAVVEKVIADKKVVETVTAGVVGAVAPTEAPVVVGIEDAGFAVLGALVAAYHAAGAAIEAKFADAGLDVTAVSAIKSIAAQTTQVATLVSAAATK